MDGINSVIRALELCEGTSSRNTKMTALKSVIRDDGLAETYLKQLFWYAFHPYLRYYYHPVEPPVRPITLDLYWDDDRADGTFMMLVSHLEELNARGSADGRGSRLQWFLDNLPYPYAKWYIRAINHDLKAGLGLATAHSVYGAYIPGLAPQLATTYEGHQFPKPWWVEPKYDGLRGLAIVSDQVMFVSRQGRPIWNTELIEEEILRLADRMRAKGVDMEFVLDGEFYAGSWNETVSVTKTRDTHRNRDQLKFHVFDYLTRHEWDTRTCTRPLSNRRAELETFMSWCTVPMNALVLTQRETVSTPHDAQSVAREWHLKGLEGGILKDPDGVYKFDRTPDWQKIKFIAEQDLEVVGAKEGNGRLVGTLGAIMVVMDGVKSWVGTEYSDAARDRLWKLHQAGNLVGKVAEVMFMRKTPTGALREPRFHRLREDKS